MIACLGLLLLLTTGVQSFPTEEEVLATLFGECFAASSVNPTCSGCLQRSGCGICQNGEVSASVNVAGFSTTLFSQPGSFCAEAGIFSFTGDMTGEMSYGGVGFSYEFKCNDLAGIPTKLTCIGTGGMQVGALAMIGACVLCCLIAVCKSVTSKRGSPAREMMLQPLINDKQGGAVAIDCQQGTGFQTGTGVVPPGAPPGGHFVREKFCGTNTWAIGICLLPCICACPQDEREVYTAPDGSRWTRSGALMTM